MQKLDVFFVLTLVFLSLGIYAVVIIRGTFIYQIIIIINCKQSSLSDISLYNDFSTIDSKNKRINIKKIISQLFFSFKQKNA